MLDAVEAMMELRLKDVVVVDLENQNSLKNSISNPLN